MLHWQSHPVFQPDCIGCKALTVSVSSDQRTLLSKTTVDDHGTHTVDVVERWDGQDIVVKPQTLKSTLSLQNGG